MSVTDNGGTRTHLYAYDKTYQVTEVNYPVGYEYLASDTQFVYDHAGNRHSVIETGGPTTSYVTNALNQYTAVGGVSYDCDAARSIFVKLAYTFRYPAREATREPKCVG